MLITLAQGRLCHKHLLVKLTDREFRPLLPFPDLVEIKFNEV
jgi:hypothetical protein